jgi:hypothetical protein
MAAEGKPSESKKPFKKSGGNKGTAFMQTMFVAYAKARRKPVIDLEIGHPRFRVLGCARRRAGSGRQFFSALAALRPKGALDLGRPLAKFLATLDILFRAPFFCTFALILFRAGYHRVIDSYTCVVYV